MSKPVKISYQEALSAEQGAQAVGAAKIPWKATIKVVRLGRELKKVSEEFQEARKKIAEQHGLKDGDKPTTEYLTAMQELLQEKVSVRALPLNLTDLNGNGREPDVEASALIALGPFLEDDWEEEAEETPAE